MTFEKALSLIKNNRGKLTRNTNEWKNKYIMLHDIFFNDNTKYEQQIIQFDINNFYYTMYLPNNDDMFADDWLEKEDVDKITEIMNNITEQAQKPTKDKLEHLCNSTDIRLTFKIQL